MTNSYRAGRRTAPASLPEVGRRALARAVIMVGCCAVAFLIVFALLRSGLVTQSLHLRHEADSASAPPVNPAQAEVDRLSAKFTCSSQGLGPGTIPLHSIIATEGGQVRLVSFDRGWASFAGDAPGTLLAVCLH